MVKSYGAAKRRCGKVTRCRCDGAELSLARNCYAPFLKELVDTNKQVGFLSSFARRAGKEAVAAIVERLKAVEDA